MTLYPILGYPTIGFISIHMEKSIYSPLQKKMQNILRKMRHDSAMRQSDLADLLKQPQSFVSKYETGERILDFLELRQICTAMGFTLNEFINRFESDIDEA